MAIGAVLAAAIALVAWRAHALTRSGALAAFVVGALTYGAGGLGTTFVLLAFFASSVGLSRVGRERKRGIVDVGKGGPRDAWQVSANGGIATACAVIAALGHDVWWFAFAGAYAAANADTWATEIGTLAAGPPRSLLTGRRIATGLSGGVTWAGSLAQMAGAAWIAIATLVGAFLCGWQHVGMAFPFGNEAWPLADYLVLPPIVACAGVAGSVVDTLVGGSLQALRRCPACHRHSELDIHVCGTPTVLERGVRFVSNDVVNIVGTATGALAGLGLGISAGPH